MPPLICPSPTLLDQTFPRDLFSLTNVGIALGEIQKLLEESKIQLILSETLKLFIEDFDWNRTGPYPMLGIIFGLLNQWIGQQHLGVVSISLDEINQFTPHPIPDGTQNSGYVQIWAEEVGKLLVKHDISIGDQYYCLGVACENAFCGEPLGHYTLESPQRCFPLVGPNEINNLQDAYEYDVPANYSARNISFSLLTENYPVIGGTKLIRPKGGSHYHIYFGDYSWAISANDDPVPDDYLKELIPIIDLPVRVIKYALIEGVLPHRRLRII